jgi:hypothetical protein
VRQPTAFSRHERGLAGQIEKGEAAMPIGFQWFELIPLAFLTLLWIAPIVIGFTYVRADANRRGQPGWLWGVLAIPLGWLAILAYVVTRAITSAQPQ